jgi:hypothetical protein
MEMSNQRVGRPGSPVWRVSGFVVTSRFGEVRAALGGALGSGPMVQRSLRAYDRNEYWSLGLENC